MRQRKWWWPIFLYFFDVTIVNAWLLWRKVKNNKESLLSFRQYLAVTILKTYGSPSKQGRRAAKVLQGVRYDELNHWLESSNMRCAH